MSYLLDALRKSESERQVGEVPKLTPDFLAQPAPKSGHRWIVLIVALVAINLGTLLYFTLSEREQTDPSNPPEVPTQTAPAKRPQSTTTQAVNRSEPEYRIPAEPLPSDDSLTLSDVARTQNKPLNSATPQPVGNKPTKQSPAQADTTGRSAGRKKETIQPGTMANQQKSAKQRNARTTAPKLSSRGVAATTKPLQEDPVLMTERTPQPTRQPARQKPKPADEQPLAKLEPSLKRTRPTVRPASKPNPSTAPATPLLTAMPRDFQREVPPLNINVFVYSEKIEERFVIIDMVKYVTGQETENGSKILAIMPDSLLLEFGGRKFRVKRP